MANILKFKISNTSCLLKRPRQTAQTQIRLLLKKQSDQDLPCLLFWQVFCEFQPYYDLTLSWFDLFYNWPQNSKLFLNNSLLEQIYFLIITDTQFRLFRHGVWSLPLLWAYNNNKKKKQVIWWHKILHVFKYCIYLSSLCTFFSLHWYTILYIKARIFLLVDLRDFFFRFRVGGRKKI